TGSITAFHRTSDGTVLISAETGLFRRKDDQLIPIGKDQETGPIHAFHQASDGTLLVGATAGLHRLVQRPWKSGKTDVVEFFSDVYSKMRIQYAWKVEHPCAFLLTESNVEFGIPKEWTRDDEGTRKIRANIKFPEKRAEPYQV